ncbi:lacto-N-biosidase [Enterococcus sp. JM4C]|uniref:family 20 glycosylhydrolase n=1 Tax=Candidatus Enterococcus huntleyi TaxID=1857217 RepID=UPI00137B426C|nr:family 20 glycosylhydrolase [Enterococcus sp. JM4C]KAF1296667.1 lacto-N-biosidase [Enterococcus sp. JM4C]
MTKFMENPQISVSEKAVLLVAKQAQQSIRRLFKKEAPITLNEQSATIHLQLHQDKQKNQIDIQSGDKLVINAGSMAELQFGLSHALIRLFCGSLAEGHMALSYSQEERIFMVDMGRKFYSKETLMKFIDVLGLFQFNYLQLHFSEDIGFRIESETYPEIVSSHYLTKAEVRELIVYANLSGIEIIPDFDSPGHLKQILANHPEWQLRKKLADGTIELNPAALSIDKPEAVAYIWKIYEEYAELFKGSTYFHIGADEFVDFDEIDAYPDLTAYAKELYGQKGQAIDAFITYVNQVAEKISQLGFVPRVWNDGFFRVNREEHVCLSDKVEITYWTRWNKNMATVSTFLEKGYTVINYNDNFFYYVLGENAGYTYPTYEKIRNEWNPTRFAQDQVIDLDGYSEQLPGVCFPVWADKPEAKTEEEVFEEVSYALAAVMEKECGNVFSSKEQIGELLTCYFAD